MRNVHKHLLPFRHIREMLGKDVRTHVVGSTVDKLDVFPSDRFMKELDVNLVCARHEPHGRVFARGDHAYRCGVVLHKLHGHRLATELFP
jgi:hypothetical protein